MHFGKIRRMCVCLCVCVGGGGSCPSVTLTFKKSSRTSDYQSNELPSQVYMTNISIKSLYVSQGITYNPCPECFGCGGGGLHPLRLISGPFNYAEQNGYLKIVIGCFWGNDGHGRRVGCPLITFDY